MEQSKERKKEKKIRERGIDTNRERERERERERKIIIKGSISCTVNYQFYNLIFCALCNLVFNTHLKSSVESHDS